MLLLSSLYTYSQGADMISVRKKNGRTLKTYLAGSPIIFETRSKQYIEGVIKVIRDDSVFTTIYDIRPAISAFGTPTIDTVAVYVTGVHYKDISRIRISRYVGFFRRNAGSLLMIGGAGYIGLNAFNHFTAHDPINEHNNLYRLGIAAAAFATGYLFNHFFPVNRFTRHRVDYIRVGNKP